MHCRCLVVLTVVVVYQTITGTSVPQVVDEEGPVQGPPTIGVASTAIVGAPPKGLTEFDANLPTGILPDGGPFTEAGTRTWHVVPGAAPQVGQGTTKVFTYSVEVEDGVDTTSFGGDDGFARMVSETLANPKSWTHSPAVRVHAGRRRLRGRARLPGVADVADDGPGGLRLRHPARSVLLQPGFRGPEPRVFINEARWVRGAVPFQGDIGSYRQYVINHEVGHAIGYATSRAVRGQRRIGADHDAADVLHQQQRRRQVRPRHGHRRWQDVPVQPLAVSDRLIDGSGSRRAGDPGSGRSLLVMCGSVRASLLLTVDLM